MMVPLNGWFRTENLTKMDEFGLLPFMEHPVEQQVSNLFPTFVYQIWKSSILDLGKLKFPSSLTIVRTPMN